MWSVHITEYYAALKRWSPDRCSNRGESWKHTKWKKPQHDTHSVVPLTWNTQKRKSTETESRLVVGRDWGGGWGTTANGDQSFLFKWWRWFLNLYMPYVCLLCCFSCVQLFATPWTVARQTPCPWDPPDKNTGVDCHSLLLGIFPTQVSNSSLLHCRCILYH